MLFNSVSYMIFLPICVILYYLTPDKYKNLFLLMVSYFFYMCWVPAYALLIACSTLVTWISGWIIENSKVLWKQRAFLVINIVINLTVLFIFKYFNFFSGIISKITDCRLNLPFINLLLPVGISFYTFQSLSYSIDVYNNKRCARGGVEHEYNFVNYALFVSFFPQLVAGPIERSNNLLPQFKKKHTFSVSQATEGMRIILIGMYKKVVIADMLAMFVDEVFKDYMEYSGAILLLGIFFFTIQIYCDFSGYSDIAQGSALLFGIQLMNNFEAPYFSWSIKEFWNRWHVSLSTWFKDYVYIPLGGAKKGFYRKLLNLMIIFIISGLWHGAKFTFVVWGVLHGIYRIIEECFITKKNIRSKCKNSFDLKVLIAVRTILIFALIMLTWTFFRADSISQAIWMIKHYAISFNFALLREEYIRIAGIILPDLPNINKIYFIICSFSILFLLIIDWFYKFKNICFRETIGQLTSIVRWGIYYVMISLIMFSFIMTTNEYGQAGAFLYFQF